ALPDERNSVIRIRAAAKVAPELTEFRGKGFAEYAQLLPQHRPSPQLVAELWAFVTAAGPALADVLALADYPEGQIAPPTSPVVLDNGTDPFAFLKLVKGLLSIQVVLQTEEGNLDAALATVRAMLYTSRPLAESHRLI